MLANRHPFGPPILYIVILGPSLYNLSNHALMTLLLCLYLSGYDHVDAETKSLIKQAVERSLANSSNRLIINVVNLAESAFDWHQIQALLCTLYVTQLTTSYAANAPLFDCTIVFDAWCGYNLALEPDLTTVFVSTQGKKKE